MLVSTQFYVGINKLEAAYYQSHELRWEVEQKRHQLYPQTDKKCSGPAKLYFRKEAVVFSYGEMDEEIDEEQLTHQVGLVQTAPI